ncbi:PTPLA-domain-containing protein [Pisolithus albus]|nr:PTPLA-domain-containing protein [Pisolithus albus]
MVARWYLAAFNAVSAVGWAYVLFLTASALLNESTYAYLPLRFPWSFMPTATNDLSRYLVSLIAPYVPPTHSASWSVLAPVQTLATLEVVHVLLGLVRSPLPTTVIQVSSRLILVWGIVARFPNTHINPFYTTMLLAWSLTEVIRAQVPFWLTWLRYTTFYFLYPLGAGSEALVALSTIPEWKNGRYANWSPEAWAKAAMVLIWIPGLCIMYSHMLQMRRKVLGRGKGQKLGGKPRDNRAKAE